MYGSDYDSEPQGYGEHTEEQGMIDNLPSLVYSRTTITGLIQNVSQGLVTCYQGHLKELKSSTKTLNQSQALQSLFDIRFFSNIMSGRGEDKKVRSSCVILLLH